MKIRFQADADLRLPIVNGLKRREPLIDFKTAQEARLEGLDDPTVLCMAANEGRLLVSHDVSTMSEHFAEFIQQNSSPGVVLISQEWSYQRAIEGLLWLWTTTEAEAWQNVLFFLPHGFAPKVRFEPKVSGLNQKSFEPLRLSRATVADFAQMFSQCFCP